MIYQVSVEFKGTVTLDVEAENASTADSIATDLAWEDVLDFIKVYGVTVQPKTKNTNESN